MATVGVTKGVTVTGILFDVTAVGEAQAAFEVRTQVTASLLFKAEENIEPVTVLFPLTFH